MKYKVRQYSVCKSIVVISVLVHAQECGTTSETMVSNDDYKQHRPISEHCVYINISDSAVCSLQICSICHTRSSVCCSCERWKVFKSVETVGFEPAKFHLSILNMWRSVKYIQKDMQYSSDCVAQWLTRSVPKVGVLVQYLCKEVYS